MFNNDSVQCVRQTYCLTNFTVIQRVYCISSISPNDNSCCKIQRPFFIVHSFQIITFYFEYIVKCQRVHSFEHNTHTQRILTFVFLIIIIICDFLIRI